MNDERVTTTILSIRFWASETPVSRLEGLVETIADLHITYGIGCVFDLDNNLILRLKLKESVTKKDREVLEDILSDYGHYIRSTEES